jgi:hypothetical protein
MVGILLLLASLEAVSVVPLTVSVTEEAALLEHESVES